MISDKVRKELYENYGIKKISQNKVADSYSDMYYDFNTNISNYLAIPVATKFEYELVVEDYFMEMLLKLIDTSKYEDGRKTLRDMLDHIKYQYNKENKEKQLQKEHPELAEIMRDYNVTKALIIQNKYK